MRCLLLTFDRLPRRWIGCYGSLDSSTRGFDRLAALGTVFDNAISPDVREQPREIAGLQATTADGPLRCATTARALGCPTRLILSADYHTEAKRGRKRSTSRLSEELHQAASWLRDQKAAVAWVRHPGLTSLSATPANSNPPEGEAALQAIDQELGDFFDDWVDSQRDNSIWLTTAGRGVVIDRPSMKGRTADSAPRLTDDLARVPLLAIEQSGTGFGQRHLPLVSTRRIGQLLTEIQHPAWSSLVEQLRSSPAPESLTIEGDDQRRAVRTADWLFVRSLDADRESGDGQLFRKPEDVCDVFDQRRVRADVAESLDSLLG